MIRRLCRGQMIQYLPNHHRILNTRYDPDWPLASLTSFDVDVEHPLQALGSGHGGMALGWCLVVRVDSGLGLAAPLTPPGGRDQRPVLAVGGKHPMEASKVHSWLGDQGGQSRQKIQRLEDHMGGAVSARGLEFIAHLAGGRQGQTLLRDGRPGDITTQALHLLWLACKLKPLSLATLGLSGDGSGVGGTVCRVNTLRPFWGPTATR